jgi:hypothetical protein
MWAVREVAGGFVYYRRRSMYQSQEEKYRKRLEDIWSANQSEWERRFSENQEFKSDLRSLQTRFNIPLDSHQSITDWFDSQSHETLFEFSEEVKALSDKYDIGTKWTNRLWNEIWNYDAIIKEQTGLERYKGWAGFPKWRAFRNGDETIHELIITPETDFENPLVVEFIKSWQRSRRDVPPMPVPSRKKPNQLDWRPVWEWRKRHPNVIHNQIAEMLDYHPVTVRRALANLDKEK